MATGGNRICAVIACTGEEITTCGIRFPQYSANTTGIFEDLTIVATVPTPAIDSSINASDSAFFPVSLGVSIMPLETEEYSYNEEKQDSLTKYMLTLNNNGAELYSFAVWGREFKRDGQDASPPVVVEDNDNDDNVPEDVNGSSVMVKFNVFLLFLVCMMFVRLM